MTLGKSIGFASVTRLRFERFVMLPVSRHFRRGWLVLPESESACVSVLSWTRATIVVIKKMAKGPFWSGPSEKADRGIGV
jgi:hypothetical protein